MDKTGEYVLLAKFMSGSVCVLPIQADGILDDGSDLIQHRGSSIDPNRQQGPHAHAVTLDETNQYAFVPDLGLDITMIYRFDVESGKLEPDEEPWMAVFLTPWKTHSEQWEVDLNAVINRLLKL